VIQELAAAGERLLVVRYLTASRRPLRDLCRTDESRAADLWEVFHAAPVIVGCFEDSDAEAVITEQRELLDALWEDCTAEMKADLADLTERDLRASEIPEHRLIRLERRGLVRKEGKKIRSSCRLMNRFASGEASEVGSLQRLFSEHGRFDHNIRALLEMRLAQVPVVDEALTGYVEQAIRHVTRPTALLLEHLQSVGNFGQHQDDDVDRPFAVTVCMTSITLCHCLARDLLD